MTRPSAEISNVALSVVETGSGRPFVFQHGLCGDAAQPAQVFPGHIGWRSLTMEARGHGASEAGPAHELSIATFTKDLAGVIKSRDLSRPVVGGISMGAAIALRLAVRHPDLVGALVLARPAWLTNRGPENMQPNAFVGLLLRDHSADDAKAAFEMSDTFRQLEIDGPDNLLSLKGFFARKPQTTTSELLMRISADGPGVSENEVRRILVPTLVIGHERDVVHPIAYARRLAKWISGARLIEITPKADDAEAYRNDFRQALTSFLEEISYEA
ncbi:alpha/beta fold hydrolase [Rhizobium leguminosarum]|uniref:alpha/beta fold hydrolase n=1 Tax=Rhizobium leguminosarum TaxID=384 RepID=UPI001C9409AC|nr:alpha/beta hydrolase [Rhizobium leguminosarum]MBY5406446.1 alpha/beta hydrolase [Rhizobium leguminosarum]